MASHHSQKPAQPFSRCHPVPGPYQPSDSAGGSWAPRWGPPRATLGSVPWGPETLGFSPVPQGVAHTHTDLSLGCQQVLQVGSSHLVLLHLVSVPALDGDSGLAHLVDKPVGEQSGLRTEAAE